MRGQGEVFRDALLDAVKDDPVARLRILTRLAQWGGSTLYLPVVSAGDGRVQTARRMLAGGLDRAEAADAIRKRFGCSLRTAQRDVEKARNLSKRSVVIGVSNDSVVQKNPKP